MEREGGHEYEFVKQFAISYVFILNLLECRRLNQRVGTLFDLAGTD